MDLMFMQTISLPPSALSNGNVIVEKVKVHAEVGNEQSESLAPKSPGLHKARIIFHHFVIVEFSDPHFFTMLSAVEQGPKILLYAEPRPGRGGLRSRRGSPLFHA